MKLFNLRDKKYENIKSELLKTYSIPLGENQNYTKFAIISTARSGSSFLQSLLQTHQNIKCFGEIFNEKISAFSYSKYPPANNKLLIELRNSNPKRFINEFIFNEHSNNTKAVGFKFHYDNGIHINEITKYLLKNKTIKIIHLIRNNLLEIFVSHKLAKKTGIWFVVNNKDSEIATNLGLSKFSTIENFDRNKKITIDKLELETYFNKIICLQNYYSNLFKTNNLFKIYYEDIVKKDNYKIKELQNFLEIPVEKLNSPLIKQQTNKLHNVIDNYNELKNYFNNTKFSIYFGDY